jgi:hypothetical protein
MSWMDSLIFGTQTIQAEGVSFPQRSTLNFIGASGADNPTFSRTDITVTSNGLLEVDNNDWVSPAQPDGHSLKTQLTTTNNSTATLQSYQLEDLRTTTVYCVVVADQRVGTSAPDGAEFQLKGTWLRNGGSIVVVKAPVVTDSNPNASGAAWTAVLDISSTSVRVRVKGDTGKTVKWGVIRTAFLVG